MWAVINWGGVVQGGEAHDDTLVGIPRDLGGEERLCPQVDGLRRRDRSVNTRGLRTFLIYGRTGRKAEYGDDGHLYGVAAHFIKVAIKRMGEVTTTLHGLI